MFVIDHQQNHRSIDPRKPIIATDHSDFNAAYQQAGQFGDVLARSIVEIAEELLDPSETFTAGECVDLLVWIAADAAVSCSCDGFYDELIEQVQAHCKHKLDQRRQWQRLCSSDPATSFGQDD